MSDLREIERPSWDVWDGPSRPEPQPAQIVCLVPAHNEEEAIEETILSLRKQTRPIDRIIVVLDNCTDRTEEIVSSLDCEYMKSVGNKDKKAGAINQALVPLLEEMAEDDRVLVMDADSELIPEFVEIGLATLATDPKIGAVSSAYYGKDKPGVLQLLQRIEYTHERRRVMRRRARVACLSGVASIFTIGAMRHLMRERGVSLPGSKANPLPYLSVSLTEDFEITLALKTLGYDPLSPKNLIAYTDVMPTLKMLWSQRLRWQRGTLETLRMYKFTRITYRMYFTQIYTYLISIAMPFLILLWLLTIFVLHTSLHINLWVTALLPLSMIDQANAARRLHNWRGVLVAVLIVPLWCFDQYRTLIYWKAVLQLLKKTDFHWD
jgi:poly-beta-1,6-N-acetyl-D-glucosamine synthase